MELDQRKLFILQTIIQEYIQTATPVGSRTISKQEGVNLSSATIRNEMSDLEELGYLIQPHASAGRIPSAKAYRLYVNSLFAQAETTPRDVQQISQFVKNKLTGAEDIITQTANILAEITQYPSLVLTPSWNHIRIKRIQLVPIADERALFVAISELGTVHDKVITVPREFTPEQLEGFSRMLTERLQHCEMGEAIEILSKEFHNEVSQQKVFFEDGVQKFLREISGNMNTPDIVVSGATKILQHPEFNDIEKARKMLSMLETKTGLLRTIDTSPNMKFVVKIGPENEIEELQDSSFIGCSYQMGKASQGFFGIVGPIRMDYAKMISALYGFAQCIEDVFTEIDEQDEEENEIG